MIKQAVKIDNEPPAIFEVRKTFDDIKRESEAAEGNPEGSSNGDENGDDDFNLEAFNKEYPELSDTTHQRKYGCSDYLRLHVIPTSGSEGP
ncbi:hypothetical protein DAPPUDRAFT_318832 [Daphnia pulex]|uniref:Uncharacterized protein n=1 Tax=Daphnia pulex TaxID=6669 RepID=E9GJS9_DAPPU|nr:hypothetical protein DAPPUDRAFT_318832 [Daphnia pulex]|eukprot:EFX80164.1 hypothetical protein DAPPUDRAFT_318832 [Daphnia pulex]